MRVLKYLAIVPLALSFVGFAQAKTTDYQVPFYNVVVNPGDVIYGDYSFSKNKQTVVCTANTTPPAQIAWMYKNTVYTTKLLNGGSVTLKDNASFDGYYADPTGVLQIENLTGGSTNLLISCVIQDMQ